MTLNFTRLGPSELGPARRARSIRAGDHVVQLYDGELSLTTVVRTFLSTGMSAGEAAIIIADRAHRQSFEQALGSAGIDLREALEENRYASLDAEEILVSFMVDGIPDPAKFGDVMGRVVAHAAGSGRNVRIYGEMVALLWHQGNVAGAIALEEMWNELADDHWFHLLCAYPTHAFGREDLSTLREICYQHSHVIPPHE